MPAKKGTKKTKGTGTHREYALDRAARMEKLVTDVRASRATSDKFLADPAAFAKGYGVTLAQDEIQVIKYFGGAALARAFEKFKKPSVAFFDRNCGCGGGGGTTTLPA